MIAPMDTSEMYLRADIDFAKESGNIKQTVVIIDWITLNNVISPPPGDPVISEDTPKLLQQITNSFVTIFILLNYTFSITDDLVRDTCSKHE